MADLATLLRRGREADSRGQLILVTAFALAAIFLGLAIIVNSAIFTENLATRSENVESTNALEYRHSVEQYVGEVIGYANEKNHTSYSDLENQVTAGVEDAATYTAIQQFEDGTGISLNKTGATYGARIFQNDSTDFTSNRTDNNTDWTLVESVEKTRAFEINVTNYDLDDGFTVIANDSSDEWNITIENSDEVHIEQPSASGECSVDDSVESIDITGAKINGQPCPALEDTEDGEPLHFAAGLGDKYDIKFENADEINGTYSLIVDNASVSKIRDDDYATIDGSSPYVVRALYSVTLGSDYETKRTEYRTTITVAPGEPR